MHQDLAAFYENPEVPNSFGGVEALHRSVKGKYSKKDVKHWLSQKDAYTLHKPVRHKFQRNRVFVSDIDRQFQADLVDMQSLAEFNKGYKYLLTCIDLFSKFAWAVPLKDKFGKSVKSGLEIIFKERKPKVLQTDAGYEQNWRRELFIVFEIVQRIPIVYRLKDLQGEEIKGTYYEAELQKVVDSGFYPVENVIKQRKRGRITEYFVKFLGYPEKFNEWVTDIQKKTKYLISKTQLPSPVCLNGEWEVGLSEIIYPHSWLNVNETNNYFLYKAGDGNISSTVKRTIDVGCYETIFLRLLRSNFTPNCGDTQAPLLRIVRTKGQIGSGLTHYKGINFQKGYGIGGIFRRLFRAALPFLVKGGKTIGKEVLMTGSRVASDVLSGENFKEAVKTRSKESGKKLAQKAIDRVQSMVGKGQYKRKHSPECVKSELELFNLPGTQTVIQDGQWKQFHPLSNVFDNAPVEFHISGSAEDYIDLSQTQLYVKAKIVKVDNTPITKDDTIGPVNLFLYIYIHYFLNKTSQLTAELFYKDSDDGLKERTKFFKESATVDMIGCIHSDLFHQDRLLLNLVDLKIKLIRSKPEFCLQGSEGFKVVLDHVSLFIRKVRVNPGVILGHAKALEKTSAKYPINRVLCKVYSIPKGSMSFIQDNIFSGQMPKNFL
ncbi:uncharacterized protein F54H12.2 [Trichonephila clavipes]|uniref:Uncharacterized protein F54H12.2 n=1 Tax=Trichonephila clavipes TaxID=2585209 RepID=A0A8X6V9Y3_TRICX|nr:uncharacterized protein F54H12.2 [Trichonephila clavipes]